MLKIFLFFISSAFVLPADICSGSNRMQEYMKSRGRMCMWRKNIEIKLETLLPKAEKKDELILMFRKLSHFSNDEIWVFIIFRKISNAYTYIQLYLFLKIFTFFAIISWCLFLYFPLFIFIIFRFSFSFFLGFYYIMMFIKI